MRVSLARAAVAGYCVAVLLASPAASADAVTEWNVKAGELVVSVNPGPAPANRALAIVQTAVYEAVNAITKRYPMGDLRLETTSGASVDAAIAAANRVTLAKLLPTQQAAIDRAYQDVLAKIADGPDKTAGITVGEKAAAAVLSARSNDGAALAESYRPNTTPGAYVPTVIPAASSWSQRVPWLMTNAAQFRPGPPPALTSEAWARDYNEIKAVGAARSTQRTGEQTAIARFWEATAPPIYHGVLRSVTNHAGREVTRNARLLAAATQAIDDALIAVFEAKYHYNFWRPVTAIRNGDIDNNDATERDPSWAPFVDTPMHPEYPCAHCIVSAAVGTVLRAEIGTEPMPLLTTTSVTAGGSTRSWKSTDDFMHEVAQARIYDGVHFRFSTEVGTAMGKQIGALAVAKFLHPAE